MCKIHRLLSKYAYLITYLCRHLLHHTICLPMSILTEMHVIFMSSTALFQATTTFYLAKKMPCCAGLAKELGKTLTPTIVIVSCTFCMQRQTALTQKAFVIQSVPGNAQAAICAFQQARTQTMATPALIHLAGHSWLCSGWWPRTIGSVSISRFVRTACPALPGWKGHFQDCMWKCSIVQVRGIKVLSYM